MVTRWPQAADLSSAQRGGDPQRGEVGRADARPRGPREDRPFPIGATDEPLGRVELGVRPGTAIDELHGRPPPTLLVKEEAGPGSDEPVVAGTVTVGGVLPVGGDRTGDDPGIECAEGVVVDPEPCGRPQREAVNDHIGCPDERDRIAAVPRRPADRGGHCACPDSRPDTRSAATNGSPSGDSIRMTSAPLSARNMVVIGPAMPQDRSRTRRLFECSSHTTPPLHLLVGSTIALTMSEQRVRRYSLWRVPAARPTDRPESSALERDHRRCTPTAGLDSNGR